MPGQTGLAPEDESCVHQWLVDAGAGAAVLFTHDPPNRLASLPPLLALTLPPASDRSSPIHKIPEGGRFASSLPNH